MWHVKIHRACDATFLCSAKYFTSKHIFRRSIKRPRPTNVALLLAHSMKCLFLLSWCTNKALLNVALPRCMMNIILSFIKNNDIVYAKLLSQNDIVTFSWTSTKGKFNPTVSMMFCASKSLHTIVNALDMLPCHFSFPPISCSFNFPGWNIQFLSTE